jgi:hypothetical protein
LSREKLCSTCWIAGYFLNVFNESISDGGAKNNMGYLRELTLCSGVFWIISDSPDLEYYKLLSFTIPCDRNGRPLGTHAIELNAKSVGTYNHKKLWDSEVKNNPAHKPYNKRAYNYYPRGRVEYHCI